MQRYQKKIVFVRTLALRAGQAQATRSEFMNVFVSPSFQPVSHSTAIDIEVTRDSSRTFMIQDGLAVFCMEKVILLLRNI